VLVDVPAPGLGAGPRRSEPELDAALRVVLALAQQHLIAEERALLERHLTGHLDAAGLATATMPCSQRVRAGQPIRR
jgi:hypothetical protein